MSSLRATLSPNDVVVETRDAAVTLEILKGLTQVTVTGEESPALGLTRWELSGTAEAAVQLRRDQAALVTEAGADPLPDLELLLAVVRQQARSRFAGWSPLLDRDHDLTPVQTDPHVKHFVFTGPPPLLDHAPGPHEIIGAGYPDGPRVGVADARPYAHPDLAGRYLGDPLVSPDPANSYAPSHATFVAGTILRRAPGARLIFHPVIAHPEFGEGGDPAANTSWKVANRLMRYVDDEVDVLNMSFGCEADGPPLALLRAVTRLAARTVLVASGGNFADGADFKPTYPGAFGDVVAAGARGEGDAAAASGPQPPWVDVTAPGLDVVGPIALPWAPDVSGEAGVSAGYATWSGSSFAAANVTGEIARLMATEGLGAFAARDRVLSEGVAAWPPAQPH